MRGAIVRTAALFSLIAVLAGCSGTGSTATPATTASRPKPAALTSALSQYGGFPCLLLDEKDLADFAISGPPRAIDLSQGPAKSCYWVVETGIQLAFIPYPDPAARDRKVTDPGAHPVEVDGYPTTQTGDEDICYQHVPLTPSESFSIQAARVEPTAPRNPCAIAQSFTRVVLAKLAQFVPPTS